MSGNKLNYGKNGVISFNKMWELMATRGIKQQYLINNGIHRATIYKIKNNDNVTCEVIANICKLLKCQPGDILEYIPESEQGSRAE